MSKLVEISVAVITVSDRSFRSERPDLSGPAVSKFVSSRGWQVKFNSIVSDDQSQIEDMLTEILQRMDIDLILTVGGTGLSARDNTPDATMNVIEKTVPGLTEQMRMSGSLQNPNAYLSRAVAGISKGKLIINLPGSPVGAVEAIDSIAATIPHAIGILKNQEMHEH